MSAEILTEGRRVRRRLSVEDRERLIVEFEKSGLTRKEFCSRRGLVLTTFHGWFKKRKPKVSGFAEVAVPVEPEAEAEIEIQLANGACVWLRPGNDRKGLGELIREIARC